MGRRCLAGTSLMALPKIGICPLPISQSTGASTQIMDGVMHVRIGQVKFPWGKVATDEAPGK